MQARSMDLPNSVKFHMRMDERSGLYVTDQVSSATYNPSTTGTNGEISYNVTNAATIINNEEGLATPILHTVTLNTTKVCLLAACIKQNGSSGTRVAIGTVGSGAVLTNSTSGGLHGYFINGADGVGIDMTANYELYDNTNPLVHYVLWDGSTTLTVKVINLNGVVYNNGTNDLVRTNTGTWSANSVAPAQTSRLDGGHYYGITCWELDYLPNKLDLKLANWGNLMVAGHKGAIDLI